MNDLRTAAQQALGAWQTATYGHPSHHKATLLAMTALKAALAEPVQEPAFHGFMSADGTRIDLCFTPNSPRSDGTYATAYYTSPPQREPLAEWQINDLMADIDPEDRDSWSFRQGVYAAEKHHGVRK